MTGSLSKSAKALDRFSSFIEGIHGEVEVVVAAAVDGVNVERGGGRGGGTGAAWIRRMVHESQHSSLWKDSIYRVFEGKGCEMKTKRAINKMIMKERWMDG